MSVVSWALLPFLTCPFHTRPWISNLYFPKPHVIHRPKLHTKPDVCYSCFPLYLRFVLLMSLQSDDILNSNPISYIQRKIVRLLFHMRHCSSWSHGNSILAYQTWRSVLAKPMVCYTAMWVHHFLYGDIICSVQFLIWSKQLEHGADGVGFKWLKARLAIW